METESKPIRSPYQSIMFSPRKCGKWGNMGIVEQNISHSNALIPTTEDL